MESGSGPGGSLSIQVQRNLAKDAHDKRRRRHRQKKQDAHGQRVNDGVQNLAEFLPDDVERAEDGRDKQCREKERRRDCRQPPVGRIAADQRQQRKSCENNRKHQSEGTVRRGFNGVLAPQVLVKAGFLSHLGSAVSNAGVSAARYTSRIMPKR